jgi:hypothetical protein
MNFKSSLLVRRTFLFNVDVEFYNCGKQNPIHRHKTLAVEYSLFTKADVTIELKLLAFCTHNTLLMIFRKITAL